MRDVLAAAGHDADAVLARIGDAEIKDDLRRRTDEAIALGIFGAPSFVVGRRVSGSAGARSTQEEERLYWGQDRMNFVEGREWTPPSPVPKVSSTMKHTLEIYWDFSSPFAYLGSTQAEGLAARTGATLTWRPMLLGGVFKAIGQVDAPILTWSDAKRRYYFQDLQRWAEHWGVPFRWPSRFPMFSLKAMRTYLALPEERRGDFRAKTFRAYWAEDRDISDDATLRELVGLGADEILARTQLPEIKQELIAATQRAVDAGVFGAPTWIVDGEHLFWGQDRIALVERALSK
jgi:2-hydroxychromene-2-carboxylate isomerase